MLRPALEAQILDDLEDRGTVILTGPPGSGKTYLWNHVLDQLESMKMGPLKATVVRMDLRAAIRNAGDDPNLLLAEISDQIAGGVGIPRLEPWTSSLRPDWTFILTSWLENTVLKRDGLRLVLGFDCPPTKDGSKLQRELYLRACSWPARSAMLPAMGQPRRIMTLVAHTTTYCDQDDFTEGLESWCCEIPALTDDEVAVLAQLAGGWTDEEIADIRHHVDHRIRLWVIALQMRHRARNPVPIKQIEGHASELTGPFRSYVDEMFADVYKHPKCSAAMKAILDGSPKRLTRLMERKLTRAGILTVVDQRHAFCMRIVERHMNELLKEYAP